MAGAVDLALETRPAAPSQPRITQQEDSIVIG